MELQSAVQPIHFVDSSMPLSAALSPAAAPGHSTCDTCLVRHVCLPSWVEPGAHTPLERTPIARRRLRKGQSVFRDGERCEFIYAVRYGSFKSVASLRDGREQVMSFHLPGELFGFDELPAGARVTLHAATDPWLLWNHALVFLVVLLLLGVEWIMRKRFNLL